MGLKFPAAVDRVSLDLHGRPWGWAPLGFLPFAEHQLGNGDEFGLYWPIGHEGKEPLVVETYHDEAALKPAFSRLDVFLALAGDSDDPPPYPTVDQDPRSPLACYEAARAALRRQDVAGATSLLEWAVAALPEYTDALALLAAQYVRLKRHDDGCRLAVRALMSPPSFGHDQRIQQTVMWLSRQAAGPEDLSRDPLWQERGRLAARPGGGTKTNDAYPILAAAIDTYVEQGEVAKALTLLQTYGEFMARETVAFQDRYGFSETGHRQRQRDLSRLLPDGPRFVGETTRGAS